MSELTIIISLALFFAIVLLWLLRPRRPSAKADSPAAIDRTLEATLPRHYRYFPQIRQALSARDDQYLREAVPAPIAQQVLRERRVVARHFLRGLREDYSNLDRLGRMVAALSPVISRRQEAERLALNLKFQVLYVLVSLRLAIGMVPLQQIEHLTELVGRLALRMEQAMAEISALSTDRIPRELSA